MREEIIGDARLILGDSRESLKELTVQVDSVISDPPYGISLVPQRRLTEAIQGDGRVEAQELWRGVIIAALGLAKPDTAHILWTGWSEVWTKDVLETAVKVKSCVVWAKNMWGIGYYTRPQHEMAWYCHKGKPPLPEIPDSDLWQVPKVQAPIHSCEKPVALMQRCIRLCSPEQGQVILDPFMGSGTTGVACAKLGRKFIGMEIDEGHFDIACERIAKAHSQPDFFIAPPSKPIQELHKAIQLSLTGDKP